MTDRTEAYRVTLAGLREELAELDARRPKLVVSIETLADLIGEPVTIPITSAPTTPVAAETQTRTPSVVSFAPPKQTKTIHDASVATLREFGRHMRALPITEHAVARGWLESKDEAATRASVGGILARKAKRGDTFTKPAKGLFGLREWNGRGPNETEEQLLAEIGAADADGEPESPEAENEAATQDDESQVAA